MTLSFALSDIFVFDGFRLTLTTPCVAHIKSYFIDDNVLQNPKGSNKLVALNDHKTKRYWWEHYQRFASLMGGWPFVRTIVALVNSMIGSSILIFPIIFVENGILVSLLVLIFAGISAAYSNYITIRHMADDQYDYKDTICRHNKRTDLFPWFSLSIFLSCQLYLYSYFNLVVKQWNGLFFRHQQLQPYVPLLAFLSLVTLSIFIKKMHFGITLMTIGIISVMITILFMCWMFYSRPQPQIKEFPMFQCHSLTDLITLAISAVSIQNVFVEILRQHPVKKERTLVIYIAYVIGILVYLFIGVFGGYGILERTPVYQNAKTIMGYFYTDKWQPFVLEVMYLIHFYSIWPEWTQINGIRLIQILGMEVSDQKVNSYIIGNLLIGFLLYTFKVNLTTFINLNGGVCLFFGLFAIPMYYHISCNYFHQLSIESDPTREYDPKWEEQDQKCNMERQSQTQTEKLIDILVLSIMAVFALLSLLITIKQTLFTKRGVQN